MALELGELVAGAYLKEVLACDVVDYNVRPPTGHRGCAVLASRTWCDRSKTE